MSALDEVLKSENRTPDIHEWTRLYYPARAELAALRARADEVTALRQAVDEVIDRMIELEEFRKRDNGDVIWTATGDIFLAAYPEPEQVTP